LLSDEKLAEVRKQIGEMIQDVERELNRMLDQASASGALSDEMKKLEDYLLAKALFDIWCQKREYAPLAPDTKAEFANLRIFFGFYLD